MIDTYTHHFSSADNTLNSLDTTSNPTVLNGTVVL